MKRSTEKGFSLIKLLIVVVIIGIIAALAVPAFQKGIIAAENRNVSGNHENDDVPARQCLHAKPAFCTSRRT